MQFEYKIKGITLDVNDLYNINQYYEAACTAEYIMDNYGVTNEKQALQLGADARRLMDKYNYEEYEAVSIIMKKWRY